MQGCKRRDLLGRDGVEDVDVALVHQRELLRRRAHQRLRRRRRGGITADAGGGAIRQRWPGIVVVRRGLRRHRLGIGRWRCVRTGGGPRTSSGLSARVEDGREARTCYGGDIYIHCRCTCLPVGRQSSQAYAFCVFLLLLNKQKKKHSFQLY